VHSNPLSKSLATGLTIASIQLLESDNNLMAGIYPVRILPKVRVSFEFKIFSAYHFWFGPVLYKMRVFVRFIGSSRGVDLLHINDGANAPWKK